MATADAAEVVRRHFESFGSGGLAAGAYYVACLVRDGQIVAGREYASRDAAIAAARQLR